MRLQQHIVGKMSLRPAYIIQDVPWYNNVDTFSAKPSNFESIFIGGIQDYLLMTSVLFMARISNSMMGGKDIMFVNRLTEPYINISKRLIMMRSPITQLCLASMIVSTLFYSSCVYGYDIKGCNKCIVK